MTTRSSTVKSTFHLLRCGEFLLQNKLLECCWILNISLLGRARVLEWEMENEKIKSSKDIACWWRALKALYVIMKCSSYVFLIAQNYSIINRLWLVVVAPPGHAIMRLTTERRVMMRSSQKRLSSRHKLPQVFTLIIFIMTDTLYWVSEWLEEVSERRVDVSSQVEGWKWKCTLYIVIVSFVSTLQHTLVFQLWIILIEFCYNPRRLKKWEKIYTFYSFIHNWNEVSIWTCSSPSFQPSHLSLSIEQRQYVQENICPWVDWKK